jgi:ABC-type multidrug transport system fused ATPase/permease subunit
MRDWRLLAALLCLCYTVQAFRATVNSRVCTLRPGYHQFPASSKSGATLVPINPLVRSNFEQSSQSGGKVVDNRKWANPLSFAREGTNKIATFFRTRLPMLQYLWPADNVKLRVYLVLSMVLMFTGKWFGTRAPFMLQRAIDNISTQSTGTTQRVGMSVAAAVIFYGLSRAMAVVCEEMKTCLFTCVSQNVLRKFAHQMFSHLHSLGSDFHLQTPSGVISVAYVRAVRGFQAFMFQLIFYAAPVFLEMAMVARILSNKFSPVFAAITLSTFVTYLVFTLFVTQWRVRVRREIVEVDNARNGFFIDSLLNQEVVKLFNNEQKEIARFDTYLDRMKRLNIESTIAIATLNIGQAVLFSAGLTASLLVALRRVQSGTMTVGDLVAVNAMVLQLALPFDFIGYTCKPCSVLFCFIRTVCRVEAITALLWWILTS